MKVFARKHKIFLLLVPFLLIYFFALRPFIFAEVIEQNSATSKIRVETSGNGKSTIKVKSSSNTSNQTNIVQNSYKEEIKVESKNGETKSEVIINGEKVYEGNEGKIEVKTQSSSNDSNGATLTPTPSIKVEPTIKIEKSDGSVRIIITKSGVGAESDINVSTDSAGNSITIHTSQGLKNILTPDQALSIAEKDKRIDTLKSMHNNKLKKKFVQLKKLIKLSELNGKPVYIIEGSKNQNLFGLFNFKLNKKLIISAENGNILKDFFTI